MPMGRTARRLGLAGLAAIAGPLAALAGCSLATSIPDLTGGSVADDAADAAAPDAVEAGDASRLCAHSFIFDPKGKTLTTVHVAGSFNGWPKTIAGGGWPLTLGGGFWTATRDLAPGHYAYKFVLDETQFIPDPANPSSEPDGFGSTNSLLDIACED
jgi:Glycogen recognition site of AMP-activated protein kinase